MRPFWISIAITASHFFLLTLVWWVGEWLVPKYVVLILGAYLLVGPLPYLYQAYIRQQGFNRTTQILTYLLGMGGLIMTLGFVWQCRIQTLKIGIPLVVTNPPRMTALLLGYIGVGSFLSYLMVLLSKRKVAKARSKPYLTPSEVTNPLLRGFLKTGPGSEATQKESKKKKK